MCEYNNVIMQKCEIVIGERVRIVDAGKSIKK
jgi:hypothetical protein